MKAQDERQGEENTGKLTKVLEMVIHEEGEILDIQSLKIPQLGEVLLGKEMVALEEGNTCNPFPNVGMSSLFEIGTLVVSLLGIIEVISPTLEGPNVEWIVPKRKNKGRNKENV